MSESISTFVPANDLQSVQLTQQARFSADQAGISGPERFADPHAEYSWAQTEAVVFDLTHHGLLELTGADRRKFLHNFCTQDIQGLADSQIAEAFVTTIQGKVFDHILVAAESDRLLVVIPSGQTDRLLKHLDRYLITEDVALRNLGEELVTFGLAGPEVWPTLQRLHQGNELPAELISGRCQTLSLSGITVQYQRLDVLGVPGGWLRVPKSEAARVWKLLTDGGIHPAGHGVYHALRIAAGWPLWGLDITDNNLAQEVARTKQAISFTKGCYLGQEPIARIDALGHVNQELRGLNCSVGDVPTPGAKVIAPADSKEIGHVTSSAISPQNDQPIALAILKRNVLVSGKTLEIETPAGPLAATVFWPE